jgi:hypothetical protein
METSNFQCGHCGKLMAVGSEFLGQQVRCPHCQQVVVAPPPVVAAPSGPPPVSSPAQTEDHEDIFSEALSEDLFGEGPRHVVEMPPEPPPQVPASAPEFAEDLAGPSGLAPASPSGEGGLSSVDTSNHAVAANLDLGSGASTSAPVENFWQEGPDAGVSPQPGPEPAAPEQQVMVRQTRGGGNAAMLLLTILVPYALLMTAVALYLYFKSPASRGSGNGPSNPLEMLPDEGLNPGVRRVLQRGKRFPGEEAVLPDHLRVSVGKSLRVGDLEVTPKDVALRKITVNYSTNLSPSLETALVLRLHLRNVSKDVAFHPVDPFFDRSWTPDDPNGKPYTSLDLGGKLFYGGPIDWANAIPRRDNPRQYIAEQHQDKELRPGEEMDTMVCTNPKDNIGDVLKAYHGPLVWRLQVRRGLVEVRNREASATAVIGVEFDDSDVKWQRKE